MKRRIIVVALVIIGLVSVSTWASSTALAGTTTQTCVPGDGNGNRIIDIGDIIGCERIILEMSPLNLNYDRTGDNLVDIRDIMADENAMLEL